MVFTCLFPKCCHNYVMASGFGMLFYRGANIPIRSRLVFRPRDFQLVLLFPLYLNEHVLQLTLYLKKTAERVTAEGSRKFSFKFLDQLRILDIRYVPRCVRVYIT